MADPNRGEGPWTRNYQAGEEVDINVGTSEAPRWARGRVRTIAPGSGAVLLVPPVAHVEVFFDDGNSGAIVWQPEAIRRAGPL